MNQPRGTIPQDWQPGARRHALVVELDCPPNSELASVVRTGLRAWQGVTEVIPVRARITDESAVQVLGRTHLAQENAALRDEIAELRHRLALVTEATTGELPAIRDKIAEDPA